MLLLLSLEATTKKSKDGKESRSFGASANGLPGSPSRDAIRRAEVQRSPHNVGR